MVWYVRCEMSGMRVQGAMSPEDRAAAEASMAAAEQSGKLAGMSAEERAAALVGGG